MFKNNTCPFDTIVSLIFQPTIIFISKLYLFSSIVAWQANTANKIESEVFEDCMDRDLFQSNGKRPFRTASYIQQGFYFEQIERILKVFPCRENFLVVVVEVRK